MTPQQDQPLIDEQTALANMIELAVSRGFSKHLKENHEPLEREVNQLSNRLWFFSGGATVGGFALSTFFKKLFG